MFVSHGHLFEKLVASDKILFMGQIYMAVKNCDCKMLSCRSLVPQSARPEKGGWDWILGLWLV